MLRKLTVMFAFIFLAFGLLAPSALAAVTFDPGTGTGFVGKGDVQLAYGWNNAALQRNAGSLTFSYSSTDTYTAVCSWVTGEGTRGEKTHTITRNRTVSVISEITGEARKNSQLDITGFNLKGFAGESVTTGGEIPVEGTSCPGNGTEGTWGPVTITPGVGGLFVHHAEGSRQLQ